MKRIVIILAFVIFCCSINAQYDPTTQVQYASPEASALSRIKEIPVDLYTGRVSFDIPLFQLKQGDIPLNISINYHGNGIKVNEESGFVGLGWTLNAGGCISRIVRELPDDLLDVGYHIAGYERMNGMTSPDGLNNYMGYINLIKNSYQDRDPIGLGKPVTDDELRKTYWIGLYGDKYDEHRFESSPDNYMFHVQGLSGAFARLGNRIILQSNDGCSVQYSNYAYQISDLNGQTYYFNDAEQKDYNYKIGYVWETEPNIPYAEEKATYFSAWWLSKIVNEKGDSVFFSYTNRHVAHPRINSHGFTQVERFYYDSVLGRMNSRIEKRLYASDPPQRKDSVIHKLLSRIDFATGYVRFYYADDPERKYLSHLDSIHIFAYPSAVPHKRICFTYRGNKGKELLTELTIYGADRQSYKYNFTYSHPFAPETNSNNYDHWGYYVSNVNGFFPSGNYFGHDIQYHGTDRQPDIQYADNNMLHTITYPTGGYATLEWEAHDYSSYSLLGNMSIQESYYAYNPYHTFVTESSYVLCGKENDEHLTASMYIPAGRTLMVDLRDYYHLAMGESSYNVCIYDQAYYPTLVIKKNSQTWHTIDITKDNCSLVTYSSVPAGTYSFNLQNPREGLVPNCYDYEWLFNMCNADTTLDGHIYITSGYYPEDNGSHNYAGGVRIKKITYNAGTQSGYAKEYEYKNEGDQSSGVLAYPPRYGSRFNLCQEIVIPRENHGEDRIVNCPELVTLRSNPLPFVLNTDGHIGYKRVTEVTKGTSYDVKKVVYNYQTADMTHSDINDTERFYESFVPTDMMQLTSQSYQRGHITSKTEFSDDSLTTNYVYDIQEQLDIDTLTGAMFTIADYRNEKRFYNYINDTVKPYKDLGIVKYRIIPYNKRISIIQKSGGKTNTKEWYTYENVYDYSSLLNANMPITHSFINSAGDTITETYTYLPNKSFVTSCITTCKGKVVNAYRYAYDQQNRIIASYKALLSPSNLPSASTFTTGNITDTEKTFTYRNNRLSEVTDCHTGQTTVYLWSYNNSYPVAEITNSTYDEVSGLLSESAIQTLRASFSPNMDAVNALRTILPNSMIVTRTFSPLVGMTSETDVAGNTTYYDYDGLGRLHRVYIMHGADMEILKQYEYHLSN